MSFKNAFKLLVSRFGYVWVLLLYMIILLAVLLVLGLTFLIPVLRAFEAAGIGDAFNLALLGFLDGASLSDTFEALTGVYNDVVAILSTDIATFVNSALLVVLVMTIAFRFLMGLYELPMVSVIQGVMSDDARYGFAARYVSLLGKSVRFSLLKMAVMIAYDCLMGGIVYGATRLGGMIGVLVGPFFFMLSLLVLLALRYSLISAWSPAVIVDGKGVVPALGASIKHAFRNFGSLFSVFTVVWVIVFVLNFIIGLFTFLAGLVVTIPLSIYLINLINMTSYYGKTGKSYYVDGTIFKPETLKKDGESGESPRP